MALYENETMADIPLSDDCKNPYLNEPQMGIELIKSIVSPHKGHNHAHVYENIIENKIFPIIGA